MADHLALVDAGGVRRPSFAREDQNFCNKKSKHLVSPQNDLNAVLSCRCGSQFAREKGLLSHRRPCTCGRSGPRVHHCPASMLRRMTVLGLLREAAVNPEWARSRHPHVELNVRFQDSSVGGLAAELGRRLPKRQNRRSLRFSVLPARPQTFRSRKAFRTPPGVRKSPRNEPQPSIVRYRS